MSKMHLVLASCHQQPRYWFWNVGKFLCYLGGAYRLFQLLYKCHISSTGTPVIKLRWSQEYLITLIMGVLIPEKMVCIEKWWSKLEQGVYLFSPQPSVLEEYCHTGKGGRAAARLCGTYISETTGWISMELSRPQVVQHHGHLSNMISN